MYTYVHVHVVCKIKAESVEFHEHVFMILSICHINITGSFNNVMCM